MGYGGTRFSVLIGASLQLAFMAGAGADTLPIGKAESVVPATTYVRGGAASELLINATLEQDDVIRTTPSGSTQVRFLDDTTLTVGPNAQILLDKGIFDSSQAQTLSIKLVNGAMRFVSGLSDRKSYEIVTPIAAIGVRGTVVDVEYEGGRAIVNFVDGSGPICLIASGACRTIAAGEPALVIDAKGFSAATPAAAARLWRRLDNAHLALAKQAGQDPSAASGAAKGITAPATPPSGTGQSSSNTTGSINSSASVSSSGNTGGTDTGGTNTNIGGTLPYVPPPPINQSVLPSAGGLANSISTNPLTYIATPASRVYGDANPTFTGTMGGLQNGDTLATVTSGTATFSTTATPANGVGQYPIDGSGLTVTSGNYSTGILQTVGNATALTIIPATLTYTANVMNLPVGAAIPTFSGTVTGLKNNDALGSVTSGTLAFGTTATSSSAAGQYPIDGSGLTVTSPNYDLTIVQAPSNATALTITPVGPSFPFTVFRVTGRGNNIPIKLDNQVGDKNGFFYVQASNITYDSSNNLKSVIVSKTPVAADDPAAATLTRGTAQAQTIIGPALVLPGFGSSPIPTYFLSSWSNGTIDYSQPGITPGTITLGPNQAFETIGWGYTGDLFAGSVKFGGVVTFNLENALPAVWSNGQSAPGTFTSGEVAVAIGTTTLRYGMIGTVVMSEGTFNLSTPGGITNPTQSGAVGLLSGQTARMQANGGTVIYTQSGSTNACPSGCFANMEFDVIAPGKVGVTYAVGNGPNFDNGNNSVEITGIATFAQSSSASLSPSAGFVSFIDNFGSSQVVSTGSASGTLQITNGIPTLQSVTMDAGGVTRTQGTATSTDVGSVPGILGWERWTNGTVTTQSGTITIPANAGLPFIDGQLATNLPGQLTANASGSAPSPGLSVQYSLVGGTAPTVASGSVAPGTLLNTGSTVSKMGIDFVDQKVGLDLYVGIGGGTYEIATTGRASSPSSSSISLNGLNGALFNSGGATLNVNVLTSSGSIGCTAGSCAAAITGFLAGDGTRSQNNSCSGCFPNGAAPPNIGINYSFGNNGGPLSGQVSGAAAFGRDLPVGNAVGYAFSSTQSLPAGSPTMALGNGPAIAIGDSTTASGLSIGSINVSLGNSGSTFQDFDRGAFGSPNSSSAVAVDQGFVSGILSWERWSKGTVNDQTSTNYTLTADQGIHILNGVLATNLPTNATYTYNFVGGTSPTVADGSVAPGSMASNSQVGVTFGSSPLFGVNLNVNIASSNYNILSSGGAAAPSLPASGLPIFGASGIPTTLTSGSGITGGCTTGVTCTANINGFLAGNGATHLGILYQFGSSSSPTKMVSGAAAFAR